MLYAQDDRTGERSDYIYLSGSAVAVRSVGADNQPHVKYQHTDALGSPVAVSNEAGRQIDRTDWEPYGAAIGKPSYDGLGYTGHMMDGSTGLTYMQQRYYDADAGRFLSVDPVTADEAGNWKHFNRYSYPYNNPYKFNDPDGRCPMCIGFIVGAGIEIAIQLSTDGRVSNWTSVGVSGAVGAVTGGLGSVIGKAAVSGAISTGRAVMATAAVSGAASGTGKVVEGALTGNPASAEEIAVATVAGAAGGAVGARIGLNAVAKVESMAARNDIAGHIGRTTQDAVQKGGKIVEATTSATQKVAQTMTDTTSSYVEKKINK